MKPLKLSVVVASKNASYTIVECLNSIAGQSSEKSVEIIAADYSTDGTGEIIEKKFPEVKLLKFTEPILIPELWSKGISSSKGEIIAITTAHCIPENNWISEILKAHSSSSYAAIGGAIECSRKAPLVDQAVYFCRYTPFMKPFRAGIVQNVPGDNASYKRSALEECPELWKKGFWETVINERLDKDGRQLFSTPAITVYHERSFGIVSFMKERFFHGIHFGSTRALKMSLFKRMLYVIFSPLIPFIFFFHIARQVLKKKRYLKKFVLSLPILFLFLISWAAGEFWGYLSNAK